MALEGIEKQYLPRDNQFYRYRYAHFLFGLMVLIGLVMVVVGLVAYLALNRPLPAYFAVQADGKQKELKAYIEPNLLPDTILRFASNAATAAYTFDFVNYNAQINDVRSYFTDAGWRDYVNSVRGLIQTIVQNQIFVYGVVSGTPVISNQGDLPGKGYTWRAQIPFLVSYRTSEATTTRQHMVRVTIVRVPTSINPQGIGIDQFIMG